MLADIIVKVAGMEKEERHSYYPRPSIAGPERCIRQMVYWGSETPEDHQMADRFILILDDSSWHEHLTMDWIQKSAFQIHSQQMKVECRMPGHDLVLQGSIDGIITDLIGVDRLLEHKAINHFTWQRYAKGEAPVDYITQSCIYVKALQSVNPAINEAVLLMKNKNTAQYLEYLIAYDSVKDVATIKSITISYGEVAPMGEVFEDILDFAFAKFESVQQHIDAKTLPDRPFEFGTEFPCGYCSWQETCWENYEQEVNALSENEADLSDIETTARFYNELGAQMGTMKKQRDEVGVRIKATLAEKHARHGKAGDYDVELKLLKRKGYKVEDSMYEQLNVKKFKAKKEKP